MAAFLLICKQAQAADSSYRLGIRRASEGDFKQAKIEFLEAVRLNKADFSSLGALQVLDDLAAKKISREYALALFISMNDLQNAQIPDAIEGLQKAIDLDPGYPKAYNVLGVICASQGQTDDAMNYLKIAIKVDKEYAEGYYNLASVYQSVGETSQAIDNFRKYVVLRPQALDGHINLSLAFASGEKYHDAIEECREALKIDPSCADAYYNMGLSYFMLDEYKEAKEALYKARELYAKDNFDAGLAAVAQYLDKFTKLEAASSAALEKK
jgi:tetratricopeptide (TPR) repeat protein